MTCRAHDRARTMSGAPTEDGLTLSAWSNVCHLIPNCLDCSICWQLLTSAAGCLRIVSSAASCKACTALRRPFRYSCRRTDKAWAAVYGAVILLWTEQKRWPLADVGAEYDRLHDRPAEASQGAWTRQGGKADEVCALQQPGSFCRRYHIRCHRHALPIIIVCMLPIFMGLDSAV